MQNIDYIYNTMSNSYNCNWEQNDNVNIVGIYPEDKIENILMYFQTNLWTQFSLPVYVEISCNNPDIESIMNIHLYTEIISQRVIRTPTITKNGCSNYITGNNKCNQLTGKKLIIEGILKQKIIYTAAITDKNLYSDYFLIPFSTFIMLPHNTPVTQKFKIDVLIENGLISRVSERSIFGNTYLFIKANPIY